MSCREFNEQALERLRRQLCENPDYKFSTDLLQSFSVNGPVRKPLPNYKEEKLEPIIVAAASENVRPRRRLRQRKRLKTEPSENENKAQQQEQDVAQVVAPLMQALQAPNHTDALHQLVLLPITQLEFICQQLPFPTWSEEALADLCGCLQQEADTMAQPCATLLIRSALYPRVAQLTSSLPRLLMNGLVQLSQVLSKPILDGLVNPLIVTTEGDLGRPQVEVVNKLVTQAFASLPQTRLLLVRSLLSEDLRPWREPVIQVLDKVLSTQPLLTLDASTTRDLVDALRLGVQMHPKDKGHMQLLLILTSKYPRALTSHQLLNSVEEIANTSQMFLKRSILGQVASIRKKIHLNES